MVLFDRGIITTGRCVKSIKNFSFLSVIYGRGVMNDRKLARLWFGTLTCRKSGLYRDFGLSTMSGCVVCNRWWCVKDNFVWMEYFFCVIGEVFFILFFRLWLIHSMDSEKIELILIDIIFIINISEKLSGCFKFFLLRINFYFIHYLFSRIILIFKFFPVWFTFLFHNSLKGITLFRTLHINLILN